ncbi:MAG: hypothetical protein SFT90_06805 [Rickettsiales bacterium]|nr:hypothetical protein [Rickettsiales bacterium]
MVKKVNSTFRGKPASQGEFILFTMMGQALLNIQVMEECLSMSITLKADVGHPKNVSKNEADELLKKRRSLTLGKAITEAKKHNIYQGELQDALKAFLDDRNWLVHKSIDDFYAPTGKDLLLKRLANIANDAHKLQREIEDDLIKFSESNGLDMSKVKQYISQLEHQ